MTQPHNWEALCTEEQKKYACEFINTVRGRYIIGQALALAVARLEEVPLPHREISNIEDMGRLAILFFPYYELHRSGVLSARQKSVT